MLGDIGGRIDAIGRLNLNIGEKLICHVEEALLLGSRLGHKGLEGGGNVVDAHSTVVVHVLHTGN